MSTPASPENTAARDPLLHLAGSLDGPSRYIEEMEAAGQRQLVASEVLPTRAPWEELEALGFVRGGVVEDDRLFTACTMPAGWTREGSDHDMWSYVLDERGVRRLAVFYKAAFYDRVAFVMTTHPGHDLAQTVVYGDDEVALPPLWEVLTDAERDDFRTSLETYLVDALRHPEIYGDRVPRARQLLELAAGATSTTGGAR